MPTVHVTGPNVMQNSLFLL